MDPQKIIFNNTRLYTLFKKFMNESTTESFTTKISLTKYLDTFFDDKTQSLQISHAHGKKNIIGKFFLETNLDWPKPFYELSEHLISEYKQPVMSMSNQQLIENYSKGVPTILLGRQGMADIPDSIIKLLNSFDPTDYIKKVAPLIVQAYRTSPDSRFQFFKQDAFLAEVAHQLDPDLARTDAAYKLKMEIDKSGVFQKNMLAERPFSYKRDEISFNSHNGTHVYINTCPSFINWIFQFECSKPVTFANGYVIYRKSEHVVSFNKGPGTPGIEITNKGDHCFVCNNRTADDISSAEDVFTERKNQLNSTLSQLYSLGYSKAAPLSDNAPAPADLSKNMPDSETDNVEKCLVM